MNIEPEIKNFLENMIREKQTVLTADTSLIGSGLLDSLQIMSLIEFLENKFNVRFHNEEMIAENFETLSIITLIIQSKL